MDDAEDEGGERIERKWERNQINRRKKCIIHGKRLWTVSHIRHV